MNIKRGGSREPKSTAGSATATNLVGPGVEASLQLPLSIMMVNFELSRSILNNEN